MDTMSFFTFITYLQAIMDKPYGFKGDTTAVGLLGHLSGSVLVLTDHRMRLDNVLIQSPPVLQ